MALTSAAIMIAIFATLTSFILSMEAWYQRRRANNLESILNDMLFPDRFRS